MIKLKRLIQLVPQLELRGSKEVEITGICSHSKWVAPGALFVAKRGETHDGTTYIQEAIAAGAVAVLSDMYDPFLNVPQLIHPDVKSIEAKLAALYFNTPSKELKVIGITGTNGKTTTSFLVKHLLDRSKSPTGLIGTIEWVIGKHRFPGRMTCPDVITNQKLLREMVDEECSWPLWKSLPTH